MGWLEVGLEDGETPPRPSENVKLEGAERLLVVPLPEDLAQALESRWSSQ